MANTRDNLLYRLRKKHIDVNTKDKTILYDCFSPIPPFNIKQIKRLRDEYNFVVQLVIR